jgi:hypothetical protein
MGLGGDLMYTAAIREIKRAYPGKAICLFGCNEMPFWPRLVCRIIERSAFTINTSPVLLNNRYLNQGMSRHKVV